MAITVQTSTTKGGAASLTTDAIDTSDCTGLVVIVLTQVDGSVTLTDSKSNIWTEVINKSSGVTKVYMYYANNPIVGTGHTFTNSTGVFQVITVYALKGTPQSDYYDTPNSNSAFASGVSSLQPGSVTPSHDGAIVITSFGGGNGAQNVATIDGGYTKTGLQFTGGANYMSYSAYLIQTSASATNPTWDPHTTDELEAIIAVFKANSSGTSQVGAFLVGL